MIADRLKKDRKKRTKRPRQLTSHVTSRWYRSPEIILQESEYSFSSDNWAIGCVLAEMMSFALGGDNACDSKRVLFRGSSCYPLTPCEEMAATSNPDRDYIISSGDQLLKILN